VATRLNCPFLIQSAKQCTPRAAGYSECRVATKVNSEYPATLCVHCLALCIKKGQLSRVATKVNSEYPAALSVQFSTLYQEGSVKPCRHQGKLRIPCSSGCTLFSTLYQEGTVISRVATKVNSEYPAALGVHCLALCIKKGQL
jgi:hypothetical protein